MFGSKKIQELEAQLTQLRQDLDMAKAEKEDLTQQLEGANRRISDMEAQLKDFDLEQAKEAAKASRAEFEGLKELYARKNREFDEFKEEEEQQFARDQAIQRHNLANEIRDNRQANQDYVAKTVRTFGESYNYYLNQIKVLMDALGSVATRTGEALFSGENEDLKARFGSQMRDMLKSGADTLQGDEGDLILIGYADEPEPEEAVEEAPEAVEEDAEDIGEAADELVDEAEDAAEECIEEAEEAADDIVEEAGEAAEDFAETVEEKIDEPEIPKF